MASTKPEGTTSRTDSPSRGTNARWCGQPWLLPKGSARSRRSARRTSSYVERGVFPGGCFFAHALAEFDAQDGPIHAEVVADQRAWSQVIGRQIEIAKRSGEIAPDVDGEQLAFELLAALER